MSNLLCRIALAAAFVVGTHFWTGCVSPQAVAKDGASLTKYKRVYVIAPDPDPRNVHPRVVTRLKALGLDVREVKEGAEPQDGQGTGFLITAEGHLLTCAHVLGKTNAATLWIKGTRFEADVLNTDTNLDLALLQIRRGGNPALRPISLAPLNTLKLGQTVLTMGFPLSDLLGTAPRLTKGMISAAVGYDNDTNQWQVSAEVQPGNSGGPLLTEDGRVGGVVSGTLNPMKVLIRTGGALPQNVNFAIKDTTLHQFLRTAGLTLATQDSGRSLESVQESVALVRAGIIPPGQENLPELVCGVSYQSMWDMFFRFRVLRIRFYDLKSGELMLQAGQDRDNPFAGEDAVLDRTFEQIRPHFQGAQP